MDSWENKIFHASSHKFESLALELFRFQYINNPTYRQYTDTLKINPADVNSITKIPFLPLELFKLHAIKTTEFIPEVTFESSGTTSSGEPSRHYVKSAAIYTKSFLATFRLFYGEPSEWCILGLLPAYLERSGSSLVFMVRELIQNSAHDLSGFYLHDHEKLYHTLLHNEILGQPTLLIGVSYALLDFAEKYQMNLSNTFLMETGGMKGRRTEITREELHDKLKAKFGVQVIHSEYGMTELLSQAYSLKDGMFKCPPWMQILLRAEDDPFKIIEVPNQRIPNTGILNIIDLANIYSCAFLATEDLGKLHHNGRFEVLGRTDASDARGCSLLTLDQ